MLVIMALFGTSKPQRWAFYVLAVLDVLAIIVLLLMWSGFGLRDSEINMIGTVLIGTLVVKALLTLLAVRRI